MQEPYDDKWYGVPPAGEKPIPPRGRYIAEILAVIFIEFVLWGLYRYFTAPIYGGFGTWKFYVGHIIAAPTIALGTIMVYWRFYRKERGLPFRFTTKRLFSSILVGLFAAILWRFLEMVVYDSMAVAAGVAISDTRTFYSLLDQTTVGLFLLMTFVQFFVVGPVEELQFRSFVYDQSARVLKNWQALALSSILFGLSHIPIALTVYKMPPWQLFVAEIGWITAGAVFGALYMWSRNIFACMVMHAVGNWQLAVYNISSYYPARVSPGTDVVIGTLTAIVVNSVMIIIFYAIFRFYWRPLMRGEPEVVGRITAFIKKLDDERAPLQRRIAASLSVIVLALVVVLGVAAGAGTPSRAYSHVETKPHFTLEDRINLTERDSGEVYLYEGESFYLLLNSTAESVIKEVKVTVTWMDESDIRRLGRTYQNQPDTMEVELSGPNVTARDFGENPRGGEGRLEVTLTLEDLTIQELEGNYTVQLTVTLTDCGPYVGRLGMFGYVDDGNAFTYSLEVTYLEVKG